MKRKSNGIATFVVCLYLLSQWVGAAAQVQGQAPARGAGAQPSTLGQAQAQPQTETRTEARVYRSVKSSTSFFSDAPIEDIKAGNNGGASVFNASTGEIVFLVPIRGFHFQKSLMQEHFNENYLESDRYPTATFRGKILEFNGLVMGRQPVRARGLLNIHGVERQVTVSGSIEKTDEGLRLLSEFEVRLADHAVRIPRVVMRNIAEVVEVSLDYYYRPEEP